MAAWSDNEVTCLITLWNDDVVQEKLEGCKKNRDVFERISKDMRQAGFDRSGVQCHDKIKKLKQEYTSTPPVMIDTSLESPVSFNNDKGDESDEEKMNPRKMTTLL